MQLLFMNQWLPAGLVKAICWTLIHSLWQGLILAALAGLLMMSTKKRAAAFRYNMLAMLFLVFMAVATGTFMVEFNTAPAAGVLEHYQFTGETATPVHPEALLPLGTSLEANQGVDYMAKFTGYFNEHATLLVTIWFIIFLAKALKLVSGLAYIQRVRHYKVQQPTTFWGNRVKELATVLGVPMPVQLLESGLVTVPMVTGILKPIILVPAGLIANLPPAQVEAILLHELAHIRRRDFLVNLAQSFAETLFFFNPAVLWLSSLLREEREHCCDDMAIAVTQSKKQYVHALVSFQEYQLENNSPYAMAFPGRKNQLLNRVTRIVNNNNKTLNLTEKTFLIVCIGLILILSTVVSRPAIAQESVAGREQSLPDNPGNESMADTTQPGLPVSATVAPDQAATIGEAAMQDAATSTDEPGTPDTLPLVPAYDAYRESYRAAIEPADKATYIQPYTPSNQAYTPYEGKYQPVDTLPVLRKGNSVMTGVMTLSREGKEYKITLDHNRAVALIVDGVLIPNDQLPKYREVINSIFRELEANALQAQAEKDREQAEIALRLAEEQRLNSEKQLQLHTQRLGAQAPLSTRLQHQGKLKLHNNDTLLKKEPLQPKTTVIDEILADLQQASLVTSTNPLSFRINQQEVVINNVVQSKAIQEYFQRKYVKTPVDSYVYSAEGNRTSSTVHIDR